MDELPIRWKRLVHEGRTCERCAGTEREIARAMARLDSELRPWGLRPVLHTEAIDEAAFRADVSESNRLWIAGAPLESWLGATAGASKCCTVCGDSPCRTVERGGQRYETVPEALIVEAALAAARALSARGDGMREHAVGNRGGVGEAQRERP